MFYKRAAMSVYDLTHVYAIEWLQQIAKLAWIMTIIIVVASQELSCLLILTAASLCRLKYCV